MALAPSPKKLAVAEPQSCWNSLLSIELYPHVVRRDAESFPERPMKIREIVEADWLTLRLRPASCSKSPRANRSRCSRTNSENVIPEDANKRCACRPLSPTALVTVSIVRSPLVRFLRTSAFMLSSRTVENPCRSVSSFRSAVVPSKRPTRLIKCCAARQQRRRTRQLAPLSTVIRRSIGA